MKLGKWTRRLLIAAALGCAVAVVAIYAGHWYLRRQVRTVLAESIGGIVEIRQVEIGWNRQQIHDLALRETPDPDSTWLTAATVTIDLSLWDALSGRTEPQDVRITNPSLLLRFNEQGELITRLPAARPGEPWKLPTPRLDIRGAELQLSQAGRPTVVVQPLELVVTQTDDQILCQGKAETWQDATWTLQASLDRPTGRIEWNASSPRALLRSQALRDLPLVPAGALDGVQFQVLTPVELSGSYQPVAPAPGNTAPGNAGDQPWRYRLYLEPESYELDVAGQPLQLDGGGGQLTIADGVAEVRQLRANLLDARFLLDGRLDFGDQLWKGRITTTVDQLAIDALPKEWGLAGPAGAPDPNVQGRASGQGSIDIELGSSRRTIRADVQVRVEDARFRGLPLELVRLDLQLEHRTGDNVANRPGQDLSGQLQLQAALPEIALDQVQRQLRLESLQSLGPLAGRMTAQGTLDLPLASLDDPLTWGAAVDVRLLEPAVAGIALRTASSQVELRDGRLMLRQLQATLDEDSRINGQLRMDLADEQPRLHMDAELANLDSQALAKSLTQALDKSLPALNAWLAASPLAGVWSGQIQAAVPLAEVDELDAWRVELQAQSPRLEVAGVELADVAGHLQLDEGSVRLDELRSKWHDTGLDGQLSLKLDGPMTFEGRITTEPTDIERLATHFNGPLPVQVTGEGQLTAQVQGQLAPLSWEAQGTAVAPRLSLADELVEQVQCRWTADANVLKLVDVRGQWLGGEVDLTGTIPLARVEGFPPAGSVPARLQGSFRRVDSGQLAKRFLADLPLEIEGQLAGTFSVDNALDSRQRSARLRFQGLQLPSLGAASGGLPIEALQGELVYDQGQLRVALNGKALESQVQFDGQLSLGMGRLADARLTGHLSVREVGIRRLAGLLSSRGQWQRLQGFASAELDLALEGPDFHPTGTGRLIVQDVSWKNQPIASLTECDLSLATDTLRLANIASRLADGQVQGEITLNLHRLGHGRFTLQADRLNLAQLVGLWGNRLAATNLPDLAGDVSGVVHGRMGPEWSGQAQIRVTGGSVAGAPFESSRTPVAWSFAPRTGNLQAKVQLSSARLARGRLSGDVFARWNGRLELDGQVKIANAEIRSLARTVPGLSRILSGRLNGNLTFRGTNVRSLDNLTGNFDATLIQTQSLMLPGLNTLSTALNLGSPAGQTFSETVAKGQFRRGIVEIERMTMESPTAQLYIDGTVTTRGRLDLNVTADTAQLAAAGFVLGVVRPLQLLRQRLIFLHIGGSIRSPVVQPRTAEFIQQEIELFFLPVASQPF
jgi:hypothetical protein